MVVSLLTQYMAEKCNSSLSMRWLPIGKTSSSGVSGDRFGRDSRKVKAHTLWPEETFNAILQKTKPKTYLMVFTLKNKNKNKHFPDF